MLSNSKHCKVNYWAQFVLFLSPIDTEAAMTSEHTDHLDRTTEEPRNEACPLFESYASPMMDN